MTLFVVAKFTWNQPLARSAAMIGFQDICYSQCMSTHRNNHLLSEPLS